VNFDVHRVLRVSCSLRLQNLEEDDICCKLLQAKYFSNNVFMRSRGAGGSQFWKGVQKVKDKIRWGAVRQVNNGGTNVILGRQLAGANPAKAGLS
jgi:hypothetical protein